MLRSTFLHVPGVGLKTEASLWDAGVLTWDHVLDAQAHALMLPARSFQRLREFLVRSQVALDNGDASFFARHLPRTHWWRVLDEFRSRTLYLDIETTGLSSAYHQMTVVGCYAGRRYTAHLPGRDASHLQDLLGEAAVLVTFNGASFDVPFMQAKLPGLELPPIHLDMRHLLRRLGVRGGLKSVEASLGVARPGGGARDGREAVALWYQYRRGDTHAFRQLVRYNYDDTVGLEYLAEYAVGELKKSLPTPVVGAGPSPSPGPQRSHNGTDGAGRPGVEAMIDALLAVPRELPRDGKGGLIRKLLDLIPGDPRPSRPEPPRIVGVDLAASESRPTGWALLSGAEASTARLRTDGEILEATVAASPRVVCIDSPLSLPPGTQLGEDGQVVSYKRIHRDSELELRRRGVPLFWCLLPSMQGLTLRGMRLAKELRQRGLTVTECYPGAAQDMLGMPRKGKSIPGLAAALADFGIRGELASRPVSHDELDAVTAAIVGLFYLAGRYEALGDSDQDDLILPRL